MSKKIIFNILNGFISSIIAILAIVFIYIEGRLLFSLEWLIYDSVILAFFKYFFRFLLAILALSHSVITFINMKKQNSTISQYLFVGNIALLMIGIFLILTASNMVGEVALIISLVAFTIKLVEILFASNLINTKKI